MLTSSSLLGSLLLVACISVVGASSAENDGAVRRAVRSFPYSVSLYRMLGHEGQLRPYYGAEDEMAALIDTMNNEVFASRSRRSDAMKGYACRFKFCRIFDA